MTLALSVWYWWWCTGADSGFQVRGGAHLKKLRRAEGGAKNFGVFRVKNHDFTQKNHIFSNYRGGGMRRVRPPPMDPPLVYITEYKSQFVAWECRVVALACHLPEVTWFSNTRLHPQNLLSLVNLSDRHWTIYQPFQVRFREGWAVSLSEESTEISLVTLSPPVGLNCKPLHWWTLIKYVDGKPVQPLRSKKNICVFTVTCPKNLGSVGRD